MRCAHRRRHSSQRGFTLVELLVGASITAVLALSIAVAYSVSIRLIGTQGVAGQESASGYLLETERRFTADVSRAECVTAANGSCPGPMTPSACTGGEKVCVAWCQSGQVMGASYSLSNGDLVRRDGTTTLTLARQVQASTFDAAIPAGSTSPQLQVTLSVGVDRPQTATFTVRSVVTRAGATGGPSCP